MSELRYLEEFQDLLKNYTVSAQTKRLLNQIDLVLLVAPTSAGRNTIIRELLKTGNYHYIVSDTTRSPRINNGVPERDGVEYWFRTEEQVLAELRAGQFVEAAVIHNQQVSGVSLRELQRAKATNKIAITDFEIAGVETIKRLKPDVKVIFVLPPGFEEWQRRLAHRGRMSKEEVIRRMHSAYREFETALQNEYYLFVVNDNIAEATEQINAIARLDQVDPQLQATSRQVAEQLYIETRQFLMSWVQLYFRLAYLTVTI